jgi:hypothetical protein
MNGARRTDRLNLPHDRSRRSVRAVCHERSQTVSLTTETDIVSENPASFCSAMALLSGQ